MHLLDLLLLQDELVQSFVVDRCSGGCTLCLLGNGGNLAALGDLAASEPACGSVLPAQLLLVGELMVGKRELQVVLAHHDLLLATM